MKTGAIDLHLRGLSLLTGGSRLRRATPTVPVSRPGHTRLTREPI